MNPFDPILRSLGPLLPALAVGLGVMIGLRVLVRLTRSARYKGFEGEGAVRVGLGLGLDAAVYRNFHDMIVPNGRSGLTQIDHVVASPFGIFVVETKNYSGWIFGDTRSKLWTVSYKGGRKKQFQNPLHQNHGHVKAIEALLGVPPETVHGIVLFIGEAEFKTPVPPGVLLRGLGSHIRTFTGRVFDDTEFQRITAAIQSALPTDKGKARQAHLEQVRR